MSLDGFFAIGTGIPVSAQDSFTNRSAELDTFGAAVQTQRAIAGPVALVEDVSSARRNVLVFYGLGGIGKTTLSRELDRRFDERDDHVSLRIDFDDPGATEIENVLLGLRATLGTWRSSWPAFDLAFAAYWERAHPGVPLTAVADAYSSVRRAGPGIDLAEQLQNVVESYLGAPGGAIGAITSGARVMGRSVRDWTRERRVLRDCPFFEPIMNEDDTMQVRGYLAALLAWDLAGYQEERRHRGEQALVTVFLDTWERIQDGPLYRGNSEELIARLVHLMPNVLFTVTGRNQLRWADPESQGWMTWGGPEYWPLLVDRTPGEEPRQHLVGGLSADDADRFLCRRLVRDDRPAIPEPVRAAIIGGSGGLPLYLDLAAVRFAQMLARGGSPVAADFGQPFPEVVLRLMRDLEPDQRWVLRIASLLPRFDEDLILSAAPHLTDSSLVDFVRRSLVAGDPDPAAPYSVHALLRDAVQACDLAEDRWSHREWSRATDRLLNELHRRAGAEQPGRPQPGHAATLLAQTWELGQRRGALPEWFWPLAARAQSVDGAQALARVGEGTGDVAPAATVLTAIGRRRDRGPDRTAADLGLYVDDPRLGSAGRDFTRYWSAWALEETGCRDEAEQLRLVLAERDGPFAAPSRHALGRDDWIRGRLRRAVSWSFDDADPVQRCWRTGIHGRVAWILGRFAESEALATERLAAAEEVGNPETIAHALRARAELRSFTSPGVTSDAERAIALYEQVGGSVSRAESAVALAVSLIGTETLRNTLRRLDVERPRLAGGPHADEAEIFARAVHGDTVGALRAHASLSERLRDAHGFRSVITGWWVGTDSPSDGVEWGARRDEARASWLDALRVRRSAS